MRNRETGLVKIRMKTPGPGGNYAPGQFLRVDEAAALQLVEGGHAEYATLVEPVEPVKKPKKGGR